MFGSNVLGDRREELWGNRETEGGIRAFGLVAVNLDGLTDKYVGGFGARKLLSSESIFWASGEISIAFGWAGDVKEAVDTLN